MKQRSMTTACPMTRPTPTGSATRSAWWAKAAEGITWTKRWDQVFDPSLGATASGSPAGC